MTGYVAFVRAVMIGREGLHREVLTGMFERAGATEVRSHISTGNVTFVAEPDEVDGVTRVVESDLERLLGRSTPLFVRSHGQLGDLVDTDPFAASPWSDVSGRIVSFFQGPVPEHLELPMWSPRDDWCVFAASEAEVFSVMRHVGDRPPNDPGGRIERLAGEPITTRSWNTVVRILDRLSSA